jgi:hypothetical protein
MYIFSYPSLVTETQTAIISYHFDQIMCIYSPVQRDISEGYGCGLRVGLHEHFVFLVALFTLGAEEEAAVAAAADEDTAKRR